MKILMVCAEFAPWAKTGGLADAVAGLSHALCAAGHDVRVLLPRYSSVPAPLGPTLTLEGLGGPFRISELEPDQKAEHAGRRKGQPRVFVLDLGDRIADSIYTGDARDAGRFIRLCAAAVAWSVRPAWRPDVIHCHDWHTALVPVLQARDARSTAPTVLTLHNVGYQGIFGDDAFAEPALVRLIAALPPDARTDGTMNWLRAGLRTADRITTVSPTYAVEIQRPEFGMGLEDVLNARAAEVVGILNGVDYGVWSPDRDPFLAQHYDATNLAPKLDLKRRLLERLGLGPDVSAPLLGVVSRLVEQKGIDLFASIIPTLVAETRATFAVLGSGDAPLTADLRRLAESYPQRMSFTEGYNEQLAHELFAGCDLTVVPSRYEPCGLTQMYALRFGTIPVVRATGGLADTIQHFDAATGIGNGSVFRDADPGGVLWGVRTALSWYDDRAAWTHVIRNAMAADFSWPKQIPQYEELYRSLL